MNHETFSCSAPELQADLSEYCFGAVSRRKRARIEAHLMECDACWTTVSHLRSAVQVLTSDKSLVSTVTVQDAYSIVAESSRLDLPFGGHLTSLCVICVLYALNYVTILLLEYAYAFDAYRHSVSILTPIIFLWMLVTTGLILLLVWRKVGLRRLGATVPALLMIGAAVLLWMWLSFVFPSIPITQVRGGGMPMSAAYLKDVMYLVPVALVFILIPFQFVIRMQYELAHGHYRNSSAVLLGSGKGVLPRGVLYITIPTLRGITLLMVGLSIYMTLTLFRALEQSAYLPLFIMLAYLRLALYFGLIGSCLVWYSRALNELKRECLLHTHP